MSKIEKLRKRMWLLPKDFTWDELVMVLSSFGYQQFKTGKTGGSRRKFKNEKGQLILLHEPHPSKVVKPTALKQVVEYLQAEVDKEVENQKRRNPN